MFYTYLYTVIDNCIYHMLGAFSHIYADKSAWYLFDRRNVFDRSGSSSNVR